jgi:hypothetical protein
MGVYLGIAEQAATSVTIEGTDRRWNLAILAIPVWAKKP